MGRRLKGTVCNRQTKAQIARREIVARLFKRGYTEAQIRLAVMEELELETYSSQTVHADVVAIKKMWKKEVIEDVDAVMKIEIMRIDDQIRELWTAWEISKEKGIYDPRYISEMRQQLVERRKLLGLYAPEKKEITGKDGKDLINDPLLIEIIDSREKVNAKDSND